MVPWARDAMGQKRDSGIRQMLYRSNIFQPPPNHHYPPTDSPPPTTNNKCSPHAERHTRGSGTVFLVPPVPPGGSASRVEALPAERAPCHAGRAAAAFFAWGNIS